MATLEGRVARISWWKPHGAIVTFNALDKILQMCHLYHNDCSGGCRGYVASKAGNVDVLLHLNGSETGICHNSRTSDSNADTVSLNLSRFTPSRHVQLFKVGAIYEVYLRPPPQN
jgi:murein DD-endopeptidase MepM/ murein hydrolase activator NlpD